MVSEDVRVLKKIQENNIDDEVKQSTIKALKWYANHSEELLDE